MSDHIDRRLLLALKFSRVPLELMSETIIEMQYAQTKNKKRFEFNRLKYSEVNSSGEKCGDSMRLRA